MWFRIILHDCRKDTFCTNTLQTRLQTWNKQGWIAELKRKKRKMNRDEQKREYQEYWSPPCGLCRYKSHSELLNQFYSLQQHVNIQMWEGHKEGHRRSHPLEMITSKKSVELNSLGWRIGKILMEKWGTWCCLSKNPFGIIKSEPDERVGLDTGTLRTWINS